MAPLLEIPMITLEDAKKRVRYDADSGKFYWVSARKSQQIGAEIGYVEKNGYIRIRINGVRYLAGRLAYLFMTGHFPGEGLEIDHINRDPSDNRWSNLRLASRAMNAANRGPFSNTLSGFKGVRFDKQKGKWHAYIRIMGKNKHLGFFDIKQDAIDVRCKEELRVFGKFSPLAGK